MHGAGCVVVYRLLVEKIYYTCRCQGYSQHCRCEPFPICTFKGHSANVVSVDFHPTNEDLLCSQAINNELKLWSINSTKEDNKHKKDHLHEEEYSGLIMCEGASCSPIETGGSLVRFQPQEGRVVAAAQHHQVALYDVDMGYMREKLGGHLSLITSMSWDQLGQLLATVSAEMVNVWRISSTRKSDFVGQLRSTYNQLEKFHSCCFTDPSQLIIGSGKGPKRGGKAPVAAAKKKPEKGALPPKKDLTRFVKWPKAVQIQRKKRILKQRLKVPPALNQFTKTLDKNLATSLFKMLLKYRPEDKAEKKERLLKRAQAETEGKTVEAKKPIVVKYGLNHVTYLIEQNKAQLVVIAHDVDPIELVVWLPALCRKMEIPYCIVKGKARLGAIVHKKTASVLCLTTVKNEDKMEFSKVLEAIKANFNDKYEEYRKKWGGGIMGSKSQAKTKAKERLLAKEAAQRMT
ncbi:hypothetical protein M0R45_001948 [Rubus argutus]|uniref:Ribosomal protein eL8/eL30/eS12/Gadd45 domain-containing protein n=1 Tax=Rubus argutus TaxID=59490 RepID=A0AAW1VJM9_RUBAR